MGTTILALWLATAVVAVLLLRERVADASLTWAIRLGIGVAIGGLSIAALMLGPTPVQRQLMSGDGVVTVVGAHSVGVPDGGPSLPLLGWSTTGGDLRIGHFLGIHALQLLSLLALLLGRFFTEPVRTRLVWVAAGTYAGLVALATWQALRGQPLLRPDGLTLAALAALLVSAGIATALVTRVRAARPVVA
ncbi:MAG TPA: hypothetical protein VGP31_06885 [Planosporangium sp.]|jgi:hypothetical protein|nr:hypothetical protein [Planosporangium sp.]